MKKRSMFVGLDVHKETIDVSIAEGAPRRGPPLRRDHERSRAARPPHPSGCPAGFHALAISTWFAYERGHNTRKYPVDVRPRRMPLRGSIPAAQRNRNAA